MKTEKSKLHPWVNTPACSILNPPKRFRFSDIVHIGKKLFRPAMVVVGVLVAFLVFWLLLGLGMAM